MDGFGADMVIGIAVGWGAGFATGLAVGRNQKSLSKEELTGQRKKLLIGLVVGTTLLVILTVAFVLKTSNVI